jgi:hypothetical protein
VGAPLFRLMARDWSSISGYFELSRAVGEAGAMSVDAFVRGPLERFFELARDPAQSFGTQARTMQFARQTAERFRKTLEGDEGRLAEYEARLQEMLRTKFRDTSDAWLLEVWEGRMGHHGAGPPN